MNQTNVGARWSIAVVVALALLTACGVQAFVNRTASLVGRVANSDGHTGVPCTATALLFDGEAERLEIPAGSEFKLTVGMLSPAKTPTPIKAAVAVRVTCEGYAPVTTATREAAVAVKDPPTVDFGTITVTESR